jgi:hypothetical protein
LRIVAPGCRPPAPTRPESHPRFAGPLLLGSRREPRPTNGIFVAMIVMNWTFASGGRLAM